jgi:hypothetical protein
MARPFHALLLCVVAALASGCDRLGIETPAAVAARKEADGKAVGAACRHAGRALEDCFALNRKVERAAIYAGWREMNEYMRENRIDPVAPRVRSDAAAGLDPSDDECPPAGSARAPGRANAS